MIFSLFLAALAAASSTQAAAPRAALNDPLTDPISGRMPTYVALAPNINDFGQFADGGPDSNWYIGFNNAWIVQLPPAPQGDFSRAFIGAKVGRAKARPRPARPWEREVTPGKVYIGISPAPNFSAAQQFFLAETRDIPLDTDPKVNIAGTGESQWFWAEVPPGHVSSSGPNYLIVWSPTESFSDATKAPVLAALDTRAAPDDAVHAWVNRSIQGVPPRQAKGALETPIRRLAPALAIKLVPQNQNAITVSECVARATERGIMMSFSVSGQDPELAWIERSKDQLEWERVSKFQRRPPYMITLDHAALPARGAYFRASARDLLGNEGSCRGLFVSNVAAP
ncbi:MAG: hypothetical protein HY078_07345 [Elusimicrobia bacterium]|nr:hypothetical protein [Elusimicrobiota bacterium]